MTFLPLRGYSKTTPSIKMTLWFSVLQSGSLDAEEAPHQPCVGGLCLLIWPSSASWFNTPASGLPSQSLKLTQVTHAVSLSSGDASPISIF